MSEMERMPIPLDENGDLDFKPVAAAILMDLEFAPVGRKVMLAGKVDEETDTGWFQARYEDGCRMTVEKACLGTRFGASLFMALTQLAPARVKAEEP